MKIFYSDLYTLPLPNDHRFPIEKYRMLRDSLVEHQIIRSEQLFESPQATEEELCLAHSPSYVRSMQDGSVELQMIKRIGFPWSYNLYLRSCATVGGALAAAKSALQDGIAGNLAGGTHHAHFDRGEGYCVFNDIAVATRYLKKEHLAKKIAIIDLDVHQGNGNSSILKNDEGVFIFSIHGEKNYPFIKIPSHLDIALPTGATDDIYLAALAEGLKEVKKFNPDFIFYQTGVDPLEFDHLGKMSLSFKGLMSRDEMVLSYALDQQIPISLALGGGYAKPIEKSVEAYANTYRVVGKLLEPQNRMSQ
jgi:acetoin utilization deacetylase AcuC-like enzyme